VASGGITSLRCVAGLKSEGAPVPRETLDRFQQLLAQAVADEGGAFEARFGKNARRFFDQLPVVFGLMRRLALDLELPGTERRLAAAAALYLVEPDDFLRETPSSGVVGAIDDVWVGFEALRRLRVAVGDAPLTRHVREPASFEALVDLAENVDVIRGQVPSRVLEQLEQFLA
jgi:uncharacterized membrane protein YkvA (DUF1232 family)